MAKASGGVTDWHKQQHKKQVQKNKDARIAARDERVVQEKTVQQVRDEIKQVERHHKNVEQRPHAIKSKLDRLQKELKLIQASADKLKEDRSKHASTPATASSQNPTTDLYVGLDQPAVSVYYDAVMNPYGAPPPGQQRLYHRRGGGTTTQLIEACTPQEQFAPPPPPPRPPPPPPPPATQSSSQRHQHGKELPSPRTRTGVSTSRPERWHPPTQSIHSKTRQVPSQSTTSAPKTVDPSLPPALPPPSASVQRCFKKSAVDIWASNEEVEYEAAVSSVSLEGVAVLPAQAIKTSTATEATCWYYKDTSGSIQGPYPTDQMKTWVHAGFFPLTTFISADHATGPWRTLAKLHVLTGATDRAASQNAVVQESSVQDRIADLRRSENPDHGTDKNHDDLPTVADRIAALRQERFHEQQDEHDNDIVAGAAEVAQKVSSVQDRIAALKANGNVDNVLDERSRGVAGETLEKRINALRAQHVGVAKLELYPGLETSAPPPPPPPPSVHSQVHEHESLVVAPYPLDEESAGPYAEYPLDDTGISSYDMSYPIEDGEDDDDVPVTGAYDEMDDSYYPDDECTDVLPPHQSNINTLVQTPVPGGPPKKKIRVDKAVVALLPSHLRRKAAAVPR